jgi:hypothetical protein
MTNDDELKRYIEYLQRQLITPGTELIANNEHKWFSDNRERILLQLQERRSKFPESENSFKQLESSMAVYEPDSLYDSFFAREIFSPLVNEITQYMRENGMSLKSEVIFVNSPMTEPNAASRASFTGHLLFAGRGVYSFCNYWAKLYVKIFAELNVNSLELTNRSSRQDVEFVLERHPVGKLALALIVYYALTGTLIGFGRVEEPEQNTPTRYALLRAMEAFIIGHELHHFVAEEEHPETNGISETATAKDLEIACDIFGLSMCTVYGHKNQNPFAFLCTGPQLLFWALKICEDARSLIFGIKKDQGGTHPSHEERISLIRQFISEVSHIDNREIFLETLDEADNVGLAIHSFVLNRIKNL